MTLIVAGIAGFKVWMVADTAITGPTLAVRTRQYTMKIEPIQTAAMVGFAGDPQIAACTIRAAALRMQGRETVSFLLQEHQRDMAVDYIYAFFENETPHLVLISNGTAIETQAAHIGKLAAFYEYQHIKHLRSFAAAPGTVLTLVGGLVVEPDARVGADQSLMTALNDAILSMQSLFYKTSERDVGGTAIPFLLSPSGARLYTYVCSTTDPAFDTLPPGSLVENGSAQGGGFGVSVTELHERDGVAIYWLQKPGGQIWKRSGKWYDRYDFLGIPSEFKSEVMKTLGRDVSLWFERSSQRKQPEFLGVMNDDTGTPCMTVGQAGRTLTFGRIQDSNAPFYCATAMPISGPKMMTRDRDSGQPFTISYSDDNESATIKLTSCTGSEAEISVTADELEEIIQRLAEVRSKMPKAVDSALDPNKEILIIQDPTWQTRPTFHEHLPGRLVGLRHPGIGWLAFLFPPHEAAALGSCLVEEYPTQPKE